MRAGAALAGGTLAVAVLVACLVARRPPPQPAAEAGSVAFQAPAAPATSAKTESADHDRCFAELRTDASAARVFAAAWVATGGGAPARHCLALSQIATGDAEAGAEQLEQLAGEGRDAPDRAALYAEAGDAWMRAGDASRAYGADTLALSVDPNRPGLFISRAVAAGALNRFADALSDLNGALALDPHRRDALVLRGAAWRHLGKPDRAAADIDAVLRTDPDAADALLERGLLREHANDPAGARADWQRAAAVSDAGPTRELAEHNLAMLNGADEHPGRPAAVGPRR